MFARPRSRTSKPISCTAAGVKIGSSSDVSIGRGAAASMRIGWAQMGGGNGGGTVFSGGRGLRVGWGKYYVRLGVTFGGGGEVVG